MNETSAEEAFSVDSVTGTFSWAAGNTTMTFTLTPDSELKYNTKYTVMISTKAEDELGTPLADTYNWSFTTKSVPLRGGGRAPRDSDDDGYSYYEEILAGTNPNDPDDYPGKPAATPTPTATATPTPPPLVIVTPPVTPKPTPAAATPMPEEPGFEAVFAIAGLLAVAYLVLRLKK